MTLLPTATEASQTLHWIGYLLAASLVLALFCIALALLLDWYEDRRQEKQAETDAAAQALRQRLLDEAASYQRLMVDARKTRERQHQMLLRQRERDDDAYYQKALKTAGEPGPWPPAKDLRDGRGFGPWPPPRRVQ